MIGNTCLVNVTSTVLSWLLAEASPGAASTPPPMSSTSTHAAKFLPFMFEPPYDEPYHGSR